MYSGQWFPFFVKKWFTRCLINSLGAASEFYECIFPLYLEKDLGGVLHLNHNVRKAGIDKSIAEATQSKVQPRIVLLCMCVCGGPSVSLCSDKWAVLIECDRELEPIYTGSILSDQPSVWICHFLADARSLWRVYLHPIHTTFYSWPAPSSH